MKKEERNRRRRFGQNFLIDQGFTKRIVDAASLTKEDTVLEIGPGAGALTFLLAEKAGTVFGVEKDPLQALSLTKALQDKHVQNASVLTADITTYQYLKHFPKTYDGIGDFIVVANLPYYAASHIIQMLVAAPVRPKRVIAMVQKEVGERICAKPGDFSVLTLAIQWFADARPLFDVPPEAFQPRPNVVSQVIELTPKKESALPASKIDEAKAFRVAKIGFSSKRKKLSNNIASGLTIPRETVENLLVELGLRPDIRAEELGVENWLDVAKKILP